MEIRSRRTNAVRAVRGISAIGLQNNRRRRGEEAAMGDFVRNSEVRGRKQYRCCLCGCRIRKGAKHIHQSGVFDGVFYKSRFHAVCYETACTNWDWQDWETFSDDYREFRQGELKLPLIPCDD
jgi:hypothetical protein